jgi:hypothetical protein
MKIRIALSVITLLLSSSAWAGPDLGIEDSAAPSTAPSTSGSGVSPQQAESANASLQSAMAELNALMPKSEAAEASYRQTAAANAENPPVAAKANLSAEEEDAKQKVISDLETSVKSCTSAGQMARICLTDVSPHIQTAIGLIGTLIGTVKKSQSMSSTQVCEKQKEGMATAQKYLALYNAACALAQARCATSCEGLKKKFDTAAGKYAELKSAALKADPMVVMCQGYKLNMAAAGVSLLNMLTETGKMASCDNVTTVVDCAKDPYNTQCAKTLDCSKTENFQQTQCICQRTPTAAGCGGYAGTTNGMPSASTPSSSGKSADPTIGSGVGTTDSNPIAGINGSGGGGASSLGGVGAGGGASGLSGGAAGKGGGADASKKEKALNANILGGFDGGGGGGGSRSAASVGNSAYKDYLPGGAHDPNGAAVKVYGNGQVTSGGSKSIWEKVSERYWEAKPTLNP